MVSISRRRLLQASAGVVPAVALGVRPAEAPSRAPVTTGVVPPQLAGFDQAVQKWIAERGITCAQLAVAKRGKILLARGYGSYTRAGVTTPVQPTSLFRIASLSKNITAAAVARLAQDGRLDLGTPVTELLGLSPKADPRLADVTPWRLLQHSGGWDRNVSIDQLFADATISAVLDEPLPVGLDDIIAYTTSRRLDFAPGSRVAYSNYGYLLLGRIIEKVTGQSYESYVRQTLLSPLRITRLQLGRSLAARAWPTEVTYDSKDTRKTVLNDDGAGVPRPYGGFNLENQLSNGRWVASAVDLVKWGFVFDAPGPVLDSTSLSRTFAVPETGVGSGGSWYGLGWYVRRNTLGSLNTWHNGSLSGTWSYLARILDGISYCAIFNRRAEEGSPEFDSIDPVLYAAATSVTSWPTTDLTPDYF
ncbi:serine hydrolase domain-containing protein [Nonomuraea jiangxiensis]|uniref:N-acyl-D-amino-acid deacylase n=1 Tax=Nonomuraea jiangxiensis TaxID=633440 RepID=A0A1G8TTL8_9ACTN|nr:serine hydrolase domain-containing protein [Nonomuraea jiangxiensis]SDJ44829.1 N-acyl-D-amino-acid deacylase [Nonomuraea jiangxiensis]